MSHWFTQGRNAFGTGDIDWINDDILVILVDTDQYTPDYDNDTFISDIPEAAIVDSKRLTGKSMVNSVARALNVTFPAIDSLLTIRAVILAKDTTDVNSSPIFLLIDEGTGFPYTRPGEDCILNWNSNGIFEL